MPSRDISKGSPVLRRDAILLSPTGTAIPLPATLLDTGSCTFSFISPAFLSTHPEFQARLLPTPVSVRLGDNKTVISMSHAVFAPLSFIMNGREYRGNILFYVHETGYSALVGLPDILQYFPDFMASQILLAAGRISESEVVGLMSILTDYLYNPDGQQLLSPWSAPPGPLAPEELSDDVDPCVHPSLAYLSKPYSSFCDDFYGSLPSHMPDVDFRQRPGIQAAMFNGGFIDVFCPTEWHGIYCDAAPSILPLELDFHDAMPKFLRPFRPDIPAKMLDVFEPEWARLKTYQYSPATKPGAYASPILCAPKTNPDGSRTVRVAVDYRAINVWINRSQLQTPEPYRAAQAVSKFPWKLDLDLKNGFHSIPLGPRTREMLAVNAPDGMFCPNFLPEGIGPAIGMFQAVMNEIFFDFIQEGWAFVIVDNIVLGSMSASDSELKLLRVLQRCREAGLTLKFEKSWYHVKTVKFFGYEVGDGTICMDKKRVESVLTIPMPTSLTKMKSFLGCANFFQRFVEDYSRIAAPLHDSTKGDFDWSKPPPDELVQAFVTLKQACADSVALFTPDYECPFLVRCDASTIGCGAVLLQLLPPTHPTHPGELVPIAFCSHKFSDAATRWSTWDQELYSIFYSVTKEFRHYLYGKIFVVENDHRNLQWLEASVVPKVVRWRLALQDFDFRVRHIPGKDQIVADYFSRLHCLSLDSLVSTPSTFGISPTSTCYDSEAYCGDGSRYDPFVCSPCATLLAFNPDETQRAFDSVHSDRAGHHGAQRTYHNLHLEFPRHGISYNMVQDMVARCPICQKMRRTSNMILKEQLTHLETTPFPSLGWVGIDILTVTPSKNGNKKLIAFVVLDTKRVHLVPVPDEEDITIARACFTFLMQFGRYKGFTTDPGGTFKSTVLSQLNEWLGPLHRISLTDRHESCGVEGTNGSVLDHLRALVFSQRATPFWDEPEYLMVVQNILNTTSDSEYGLSPNELTYGSAAMIYFQLPSPLPDPASRHEYLRNLNNYIQTAREESAAYHATVLASRARVNDEPLRNQILPPGSLVLWSPPDRSRAHKLRPTLLGPYTVLSQENGEVTCRQLATQAIRVFHISRLKEYYGDAEDGFELAKRDDDQYGVTAVLGHRGDPVAHRKYMTFLLRFDDGDENWIQYCPDLVSNVCWQSYCRDAPELKILLRSATDAGTWVNGLRRLAIPISLCPSKFYLDLRYIDFTWYDTQCKLPNSDTETYVVEARFSGYSNTQNSRANVYIPVFDLKLSKLDYYWFQSNAYRTEMDPRLVTLVDSSFVLANPQLVGHDSDRLRVLRREYAPALAGTYAQRRGKFRASDTDLDPTLVTSPRSSPRHTTYDNDELAAKATKAPRSRAPSPRSQRATNNEPSPTPSRQSLRIRSRSNSPS